MGEYVLHHSDLHKELEMRDKRRPQRERWCTRCMVEPEQSSSWERRGQLKPAHFLETAWRSAGRVGVLVVR